MISDELYVCLILTAPLYAAFTTLLFPVPRSALVAVGLFWLVGTAIVLQGTSASIFFGSWLGSTVEESVSILLEFRVDRISALGIATVAASLLASPFVAEFASGRDAEKATDRPVESAPRLLALVALCGLACTATDLSVLAVLWLLLDVTLANRFRTASPEASANRAHKAGPLKPLQLSSLLLIVAVLMINARYGTLRVDELDFFHQPEIAVTPDGILEGASLDRRVDSQAVRTGICVFLALAVFCRAAVFPWLLWRERTSNRRQPLDLIVVPSATLIPASVLLLRLFPLRSEDTLTPFLLLSLLAASAIVVPLIDRLIAVPLRVASKAAELFDRHLMGGSREGAWLAHCQRAVGNVEYLRGLDPRYAALAAVLCLAGLLLALTGTGG